MTVRPLDLRHLGVLKQHWSYARYHPCLDILLRDGLSSGISAGVFNAVDDAQGSSDTSHCDLISWTMLNHNGEMGFTHTLPAYRGRGLALLTMSETTRRFIQHGYPRAGSSALPTASIEKTGWVKAGSVMYGTFRRLQ